MAYRKAPVKLSEPEIAAIRARRKQRQPSVAVSRPSTPIDGPRTPIQPQPQPTETADPPVETAATTALRRAEPSAGSRIVPGARTVDIDQQIAALRRVGTTRAPGPVVQRLRPLLVPVVARCLLPLRTAENTLRWMYAAAGHIESTSRRTFELTMFTEQNLHEWAQEAMGHLESKTRHAGKQAILRVVNFDDPNPPKVERSDTLRPYSPRQISVAEAEALAIGDNQRWGTVDWGTSWTNLVDLTAHAGARPSEALRVLGADIEVTGPRTTVTLVNDQGVVRRVPVYDQAGRRLARHAGFPGALVYDRRLQKRRDATDRLKKWARKHGYKQLSKFRITRARHAWITELISMDLSLRVVCTLADFNAGNFAVTDLASYQPAVRDNNVRTAMERARQHPTLPIIRS